MEQTLGKRIAHCRKAKGMTQEKLAEALGVTAQAVSKWEHDQSCPDITMLPKLAEIFGVTTDSLLGRERETLHTAELITEAPETDNANVHVQKGDWEFKYTAGKQGAIFGALLILAVGVLTLLKEIYQWEVSFWAILWPSALLILSVQSLFRKFSFFSMGGTLFSGYFLLSNLQVIQLELGGMILPIFIILLGLSLLVDSLRKPKKNRFSVKAPGGRKSVSDYTVNDEQFECSASFCDCSQLVSLPLLRRGEIDCSFCNLTVDLSGCEAVTENCRISADCSFGNLTVLVPAQYQIVPDTDTTFGDVHFEGQPDSQITGKIRMECDVSFGQITVQYI